MLTRPKGLPPGGRSSLIAMAGLLSIFTIFAGFAAAVEPVPVRPTEPQRGGDWNTLTNGKVEPSANRPPAPAPAPAPAAPTQPPVTAVVAPAPTAAAASPTVAPTAPPTGAFPAVSTKPGEFDKTDLRRTVGAIPDSPVAATPAPATGGDVTRICAALAIVLGLIFLLRWGSRKFFVTPDAGRSNRVINVVTRSVLSPKQQLILLRIGRRLVLVGDSGGQMSPLCEITDPDEMASIQGQLVTERDPSAVVTFGSLFGRIKRRFDGGSNVPDIDPQSLDETLDRIASGDSRDAEIPDETPVETVASPRRETANSSVGLSDAEVANVVATTRQELDGLRDKLRMVSRQFREEGLKKGSSK